MDTQTFVRSRFAEFYEEMATNVEPPSSLEQREFGFLLFKENVMIRHKGFARVEDLASFIKHNVPSHAYYSTAYYEMPEEKMEDKGWLGADLYFDIDADHIPTKCSKVHDTWTCKSCGFAGKGVPPEKCPACDGRSFEDRVWPCEVCLETAKQETQRLSDIMTVEFGFSPEEVSISFSGHRGYHLHVESEAVGELDSVARKEIVDYVTGVGLEAAFHKLEESGLGRPKITSGPDVNDIGWRGRIARGTREFLQAATEEDLKRLGFHKKAVEEIVKSKDMIAESWKRTGPWAMIKSLGAGDWKVIIQQAAEKQSVKVDTVVTTDIHRLIRLPNSLHGKTGLLKVRVQTGRLEVFDPLRSAVAFKRGEATLYIDEAPQFRLGEETYGPFRDRKSELPMAAALFLLCKGAAKVVS